MFGHSGPKVILLAFGAPAFCVCSKCTHRSSLYLPIMCSLTSNIYLVGHMNFLTFSSSFIPHQYQFTVIQSRYTIPLSPLIRTFTPQNQSRNSQKNIIKPQSTHLRIPIPSVIPINTTPSCTQHPQLHPHTPHTSIYPQPQEAQQWAEQATTQPTSARRPTLPQPPQSQWQMPNAPKTP